MFETQQHISSLSNNNSSNWPHCQYQTLVSTVVGTKYTTNQLVCQQLGGLGVDFFTPSFEHYNNNTPEAPFILFSLSIFHLLYTSTTLSLSRLTTTKTLTMISTILRKVLRQSKHVLSPIILREGRGKKYYHCIADE